MVELYSRICSCNSLTLLSRMFYYSQADLLPRMRSRYNFRLYHLPPTFQIFLLHSIWFAPYARPIRMIAVRIVCWGTGTGLSNWASLVLLHSFGASYIARSQLSIPSQSTVNWLNLSFLFYVFFNRQYRYQDYSAPPSILGFTCMTSSVLLLAMVKFLSGYISYPPMTIRNQSLKQLSIFISSL